MKKEKFDAFGSGNHSQELFDGLEARQAKVISVQANRVGSAIEEAKKRLAQAKKESDAAKKIVKKMKAKLAKFAETGNDKHLEFFRS